MRYAPGHKQQTRDRILRAAGKVFLREGYHAAGVDKVMEEAGLTAGGFYSHFDSKEALLAEMLAAAAAVAAMPREEELGPIAGRDWAASFVDRYLSLRHVASPEDGCPLPALVSEVARSGDAVKASFEAIVLDLAVRMKQDAGEGLSEDRSLAIIALCVGGIGVARSVQDESLGERILTACRELARAGLVSETSTSSGSHSHRKKS
jgi:TetR/AcrR family transcriptional regulator, transcriptional repressor for nem operon